jgi:MoxR-like ATPase
MGSYFQRGLLPIAYEVANHFKHAVLYLDEIGATEYELQKWLNRPLDARNSCFAGGKLYRLNEGCKLSVIATTNPIEYAGVNNLTEDLKSRFIGSNWDYPSSDELTKIINWDKVPDFLRDALVTFAQDTYSLRTKNDVDYTLSPRDMNQFTSVFRDIMEDTNDDSEESLEVAFKEAFLIKYTDPSERELIKSRAEETLGVSFSS